MAINHEPEYEAAVLADCLSARERAVEFLIARWRLQNQVSNESPLTVSLLAQQYIKSQVNAYCKRQSRQDLRITPSLAYLATARIIKVLESSEDPAQDAQVIADNLSSHALQTLLCDPRLPYRLLRLFCNLPQTLTPAESERRLVDIDDAVLQNERYMRSRKPGEDKETDLIRLDDLCSLIPGSKLDSEFLSFVRKDPPKGGYEVLDAFRPREMCIYATDLAFTQAFKQASAGILDGLDWTNVVVGGGSVLSVLQEPASIAEPPIIQLYLFGLGASEANRKVEHIHEIWCRNLSAADSDRLIIKNTRTIEFFTSGGRKRLQIVLRLYQSPLHVLHNFDLDVLALGYDGTRVLLLPRCARAIETGYSTFTMDLVHGQYLGNRHSPQDYCALRYAERGFGNRILPSYAQLLEEVADTSEKSYTDDKRPPTGHLQLDHPWNEINRYPHGREPGLKSLKRIAFLGRDFVHRMMIGQSPLMISPERYAKQMDAGHIIDTAQEREWQNLYDKASHDARELQNQREAERNCGMWPRVPDTDFRLLGMSTWDQNFFDVRLGIQSFEMFMRHCEAWRLHALGTITVSRGLLPDRKRGYDAGNPTPLRSHMWCEEEFRAYCNEKEDEIDDCNLGLWADLKKAICWKLGIPLRDGCFNPKDESYDLELVCTTTEAGDTPLTASTVGDYSTRKVRVQVYGYDLASVQEKQITIPVIVPCDLEDLLLTGLQQHYPDLPVSATQFPSLIPVHDPSTYNPSSTQIPSLLDTTGEKGNLRYWVITNESMWAGQHPALDAAWQVLEGLVSSFQCVFNTDMDGPVDTDSVLFWGHLARHLRTPYVLHEIVEHYNMMENPASFWDEARLFQSWALDIPFEKTSLELGFMTYPTKYRVGEVHDLFDAAEYLYPFPDELFWKDGDEGELEKEGIAQWKDPS